MLYCARCFIGSLVMSQKLDFEALEKTTEYDGGYNKHSQIIK